MASAVTSWGMAVGQHGAEAITSPGPAILRIMVFPSRDGGRDFYLSVADHKDIARWVALGEELGAAGMTIMDADAVIIGESLGREIAEHSQMAMLAINTIFREGDGDEIQPWVHCCANWSIAHFGAMPGRDFPRSTAAACGRSRREEMAEQRLSASGQFCLASDDRVPVQRYPSQHLTD